jgi:hypothetical protein
MIRLTQLPWGLAAALLAAVHVSAGPSVNVGMKAAFPAAPYLIELLYEPRTAMDVQVFNHTIGKRRLARIQPLTSLCSTV